MAKENPRVVISINENLCKGADGCGICLALCPKDVFKIAERLTARGIRPPQVEKVTACTDCFMSVPCTLFACSANIFMVSVKRPSASGT